MTRTLTFVLTFFVAAASSVASTAPTRRDAVPLDTGWEYRWGDSPFVDGVPVWTKEKREDSDLWKPIEFPSDPPNRDGRTNAWFRIRLPSDTSPGRSIYIYSIDLIGEVYFRSRRIYRYGTFEADGTGRFVGWPWHLFDLPANYGGEYLYFRVYSDYPDIGLWGEVALGTQAAHLRKIVRRDLFPASVGVSCLFFGVPLLVVSAIRRRGLLFLLGLLLINLGIIPIQESQIKQLVWFAPEIWQHLAAANYFLLPATMAGLVHALYGRGLWGIHCRVWQLHLLFCVGALAVAMLGWINLSATYIAFDWLALFTVLGLTVSLHSGASGSTNRKFLTAGFWLMYAIMVYNGLTAHGILPWPPRYEYLGSLLLGGCFALIVARQYNAMKLGLEKRSRELEELNRDLENKVHERTRELEVSNETKDQLFAIIADDLRGNAGTLNNLLDEFGRDGRGISAEDTETLRQSASATYELLENLLTWARGQRGELTPEKAPFTLDEVVERSFRELKSAAAKKSITLHPPADSGARVKADREMIQAVLRNLVGNAIKFGHPGGEVRISIEPSGDDWTLRCKDDGTGMPAEQTETLFRPKDGSRIKRGTYGEKGSGLGLLLCQEFIHLNDGRIGAESVEGEGTTIWFTLPAAS